MSSAMAVREQHGKDESHHTCHPADLVVWPNDRDQVCQVAKLCNDHCIPLIPFGSGTGLEGGVVAKKVDDLKFRHKSSSFVSQGKIRAGHRHLNIEH